MGRGRKAKPAVLKILDGNPGQRPIGKEPKPSSGAPECPDYLDAEARREWERIVPELDRMGLLSRIDGSALEAHCANYSRAVRAEKEIADVGITVTTENGLKKNPACTVADSCWRLVRSFLSELGLSPASRAKFGNANAAADELDEWERETA